MTIRAFVPARILFVAVILFALTAAAPAANAGTAIGTGTKTNRAMSGLE